MHLAHALYGPLTPLYDMICGRMLQPGRRRAMSLLAPQAGERILEVGIGTGYGANDYPEGCRIVGIDLSLSMLKRATRRVGTSPRSSFRLCQMDATNLAFPSRCFDAVYVPYTINCVPEPVLVGRELQRVCTPQGRIVFLNHFDGIVDTSDPLNAVAGKIAEAFDVNWHLRLDTFLASLNLRAKVVESVNVPRLSSVVLCEQVSEG